eukprot:g25652.t1
MGQNTSTAVLEAVNTMTGGVFPTKDPLDAAGSCIFDDKVMAEKLPAAVLKRFQECVITGAPTTEEDQKVIADTIYEWARERGAIDFAHWFFPLRGGGGAVGGMLGAYKQDTLLDLDFASKYVTKPMKACLPSERLFQGETDGSSFPNGGLRVTHSAAAFTTWDRTSPPFVLNKTLYIPCAFITHFGKCIDEKTPLLRSMDAVKEQGLRLLKAVGLGKDAKTMHSYLGWEQEFFVIDAAHYKARPDLVNTGRTLFGKLPTRHQQGDLNYFQPIPTSVALLLDRVQALMLEVGCPMAVKHNEELVRCTVATAGNDHRLGAQEAPPAIISLYPGQGFEAYVDSENKHVIFTGNGYSAEWKEEAAKRGLPNLNTTPKAVATWNSEKNSKLFETLKIYTPEETAARQEVMYENYIGCLSTEAETMVNMTETGILPACAKDLQKCSTASNKFATPRKVAYEEVVDRLEKLKSCLVSKPHGDLEKEAAYFCDTVKPLMVSLRESVDNAESLMETGLYPYSTYEQMIYSHHF